LAAALAIALSACDSATTRGGIMPLPGSITERGSAAPPGAPRPGGAAPVTMTGRWVLAMPNAGFCNMTFAGTPGTAEGTIAPEGGCPGNFFTSRKWAFEPTGLVIRDHNGVPLAELNTAAPNRLEGRATSGEQVSLTR
jgi:Protease inhibitor Inh